MLTTSLPDTRPNRSSLPRLFDTVADTINLAGGLPDPQLFPSSDISDSMRSMLRLGGRTLLQYSTYRVPGALASAIAGAMELVERRWMQLISSLQPALRTGCSPSLWHSQDAVRPCCARRPSIPVLQQRFVPPA